MSTDSTIFKFRSDLGGRGLNQQSSLDDPPIWMPGISEQTKAEESNLNNQRPIELVTASVEIAVHQETPGTPPETSLLHASASTALMALGSSENLIGEHTIANLLSGPSSPSNLSAVTLIGSTGSGSSPNCREKDLTPTQEGQRMFKYSQAPTSPLPERKRKPTQNKTIEVNIINVDAETRNDENVPINNLTSNKNGHEPEKLVTKPSETTSSKPKIISAIAKNVKSELLGKSHSKVENVLQPMDQLSLNRRPSTGTIGIPIAALTQHRRSLQLNSSGIDTSQVFIYFLKKEHNTIFTCNS